VAEDRLSGRGVKQRREGEYRGYVAEEGGRERRAKWQRREAEERISVRGGRESR
jgi:hypothetical protein